MPKLSRKQTGFVREYCVDWNATRAAIRAGYSERSAYSTGHRLLRKDEIQAAVREEQDRLSERTRISRDRIMKELSRSGFADMRNFATWAEEGVRFVRSEELSADDSPAIKEVSSERRIITNKDGDIVGETVTTSIKLHDKKAALELMGRNLGMWAGGGEDEVTKLADTFLAGAETMRKMEVDDLSEG